MIAKDFSRADDQWRVGVLFSISGQNADTFGAKFATTNAGLLYTAKGTASLLVPIANYMQQSSGTWDNVFIIAAGANILASLLAIAVLKPWRKVVISKAVANM